MEAEYSGDNKVAAENQFNNMYLKLDNEESKSPENSVKLRKAESIPVELKAGHKTKDLTSFVPVEGFDLNLTYHYTLKMLRLRDYEGKNIKFRGFLNYL